MKLNELFMLRLLLGSLLYLPIHLTITLWKLQNWQLLFLQIFFFCLNGFAILDPLRFHINLKCVLC